MEPQARSAAVRPFAASSKARRSTLADLSLVLLVTEEEVDRAMATLTVAQLPAVMRRAGVDVAHVGDVAFAGGFGGAEAAAER
ncbi:hypothetical protein [Streptomyces sp. SAS_270]|uniref:hypothetical protein n=1 Tax=Streptomyces sp. SAS_270 TaxID=3412748 RepID=UPI00403C4B33